MRDLSLFKTIHQDIKPENAFLDQIVLENDVYDGVPDRPMPVLADFGEADYTNEADSRNPKSFHTGGTPGYKPPEELHVKSYMARVGDRGTSKEDRRNLKPFAATANNVWGIGRTVFELMTHIGGTDFGWALKIMHGEVNPGEGYEEFVATQPFSSRLEDWQEVLELCVHAQLKDSFPYSDHLRKLIADMLHPNQYTRPTIPEIERRAEKGLVDALATMNNQYKEVTDKSGKPKRKKLQQKELDAKKALYFTQEHWANIPPGVIEWSEPHRRELDRLRAWARNVYSSMDPEGPVIKQPKFMRDAGESWEPFSEMARAMAIQRSDGKIVALKDLRVLQLGSAIQLQRTLSRGGTAAKKESTKRPRADDHDDATKQPRKKTIKKPATSKEKTQEDDTDLDADSEQGDAPLAKKTRKASNALATKASKTKPAVDKSKKTKASKQKSKSTEAEVEEEEEEAADQNDSAGARRSGRTRKAPTRLG